MTENFDERIFKYRDVEKCFSRNSQMILVFSCLFGCIQGVDGCALIAKWFKAIWRLLQSGFRCRRQNKSMAVGGVGRLEGT